MKCKYSIEILKNYDYILNVFAVMSKKFALHLTMSKCHIKSKIIGGEGLRKNIFVE